MNSSEKSIGSISQGYKEWSAVVDALGNGTQTVMVRSYKPRYSPFLLYPTFSYSFSGKPEDMFQKNYLATAIESASRTAQLGKNELQVEIRYFAEVDKVIQVGQDKWQQLEPFFIWSHKHILKYVNKLPSKTSGFLWVVRIHRLHNPVKFARLKQGGSPAEYQHFEPVSMNDSKLVLSNSAFRKVKNEIFNILK